jgi:5'-methylthioadenosine phosphorylase
MSIIGMTASPEAFLAREAGMCYATMAHVTDYDVWHVTEKPVTVEMVLKWLKRTPRMHKPPSRIWLRSCLLSLTVSVGML